VPAIIIVVGIIMVMMVTVPASPGSVRGSKGEINAYSGGIIGPVIKWVVIVIVGVEGIIKIEYT
jgi:hypothetical protein